jgi:hypothetical protein
MTTGGSVYSARTAAIDLAHAAEDYGYGCSDYKCLALDGVAAGCKMAAPELLNLLEPYNVRRCSAGTLVHLFVTFFNICSYNARDIFPS